MHVNSLSIIGNDILKGIYVMENETSVCHWMSTFSGSISSNGGRPRLMYC